jgi:hypothetical protein
MTHSRGGGENTKATDTTSGVAAQSCGFAENFMQTRWWQWRLHSSARPRRQWKAHRVPGRQIRDGTAWQNRELANFYIDIANGDFGGRVWVSNPGAYAVVRDNRVIVVGSTWRSLQERISGHHLISRFGLRLRDLASDRSFVLADSDLVVFYRCSDGPTAEQLESCLFCFFHPPLTLRAPAMWSSTLSAMRARRRQSQLSADQFGDQADEHSGSSPRIKPAPDAD